MACVAALPYAGSTRIDAIARTEEPLSTRTPRSAALVLSTVLALLALVVTGCPSSSLPAASGADASGDPDAGPSLPPPPDTRRDTPDSLTLPGDDTTTLPPSDAVSPSDVAPDLLTGDAAIADDVPPVEDTADVGAVPDWVDAGPVEEDVPMGDVGDPDVAPAPDAGPDVPEPGCGEADDEKLLPAPTAASKIVAGAPEHDPAVVELRPGQLAAIGSLWEFGFSWQTFQNEWQMKCTATLIGDRVVLSAAHCIGRRVDAEDLAFRIGPDSAAPVATFYGAEVHVHPDYTGQGDSAAHDVSVLILETSPLDAELEPPVETIPVNLEPLPDTFLGSLVQNVGYGATVGGWTSSDDNTERWWTVEEVTEVVDSEFTVYGGGVSSVCFGDSGGPSLWTYPDGAVRVAGVVSWGDPSCVDYDHFARTDDAAPWLIELLGDPPGLCGDETFEGRCDGDTAIWCAHSPPALESLDCVALGWTCGENEAGNTRCLPGTCDDTLTWEGRCLDGDVAQWCDGGELRERRCLPCDQVCKWGDDGLGFYCR